jgi:hypothetical protein
MKDETEVLLSQFSFISSSIFAYVNSKYCSEGNFEFSTGVPDFEFNCTAPSL